MMKLIRDIRIYKSSETAQYVGVVNKSLNLALRRVTMKLSEQGFSLGSFDHLYLNFTVCRPEGTIALNEEVDRYHPWYRYCDVGVSQYEYDRLENTDCTNFVYAVIESVLLRVFCSGKENGNIVKTAITEARKGPEMLMRFKEKKSAKGIATIYLRLLESGKYHPLLCVENRNGEEVLRRDLPKTMDLAMIGEIQLSCKKVTVKPRKNAYTKNITPISFEIELS